jgi:hypothetical protein
MIRLFSTVLRREPDGRHVLVTPVEKLEIDVEATAFRATEMQTEGMGRDRSIAFRQVRGDFKANRGIWEFEPAGLRTLLRYRVEIDPPGYVPNWLARSSFKRELPRMLAQLRQHCESEQRDRTHANIFPY